MEVARFPLPTHKWKTGKEPPLHMLQTTPQAAIFAFVLFQHRLEYHSSNDMSTFLFLLLELQGQQMPNKH